MRWFIRDVVSAREQFRVCRLAKDFLYQFVANAALEAVCGGFPAFFCHQQTTFPPPGGTPHRANTRIQKFDSAGTFLTTWGDYGSGNGQFAGATGVAVDGSGNV
jgi:hypothetical protein